MKENVSGCFFLNTVYRLMLGNIAQYQLKHVIIIIIIIVVNRTRSTNIQQSKYTKKKKKNQLTDRLKIKASTSSLKNSS